MTVRGTVGVLTLAFAITFIVFAFTMDYSATLWNAMTGIAILLIICGIAVRLPGWIRYTKTKRETQL
jgi:uncharacterized membrane protein YidH (DUF202 family)